MHQTTRFPAALGMSALLHIAILLSLVALNISPAQKVLNQIEVNYLRLKPKAIIIQKRAVRKLTQKDFDRVAPGQRLILSERDKIPEKGFPAQRISSPEEVLLRVTDIFEKPVLSRTEFIRSESIKLSPVEIDGSMKVPDNSAYLTYNNYLHERIRRSIYNKFYYINGKGTACIKFTIKDDGSLAEARLIDEKSNASDKLKRIALDGLKDAAPFPALPKGLNSSFETFWVNVHFIEEEN